MFCDSGTVRLEEGKCGSVSPLISLLILLFINHLPQCRLAYLTCNSILHPTREATLFLPIVKLPDDHRSAFVCIVTVATISCGHKFVRPSAYVVGINRSVIGNEANRIAYFQKTVALLSVFRNKLRPTTFPLLLSE